LKSLWASRNDWEEASIPWPVRVVYFQKPTLEVSGREKNKSVRGPPDREESIALSQD
jgi:hypothetical protein